MMTVNQILAELLEQVSAQIRAKGRQDQYCSVTVQPGNAVVFDFGGECTGMAWVRLVGASPTSAFPSPETRVNACAITLAYTVEVGMVGPAPVLEDNMGNFSLPEDTELFEAAMRQAEEMQMMFDAIRAAAIPEKVIGDYAPQGPEGGVMGGLWTVIVGGDE